MKCLICGRAIAPTTSSAHVVAGQVEGKEFILHTRCFIYDTAALASRMSDLIGYTDSETEKLTELGQRSLGPRV